MKWYLRYNLSFRNLVEMMEKRDLSMAHTTIMRWVHQYRPELDKRVRRHLKPTNDSWRADETYIKVKGHGCIYIVQSIHISNPRAITVDKNSAYPIAVEELRKEKTCHQACNSDKRSI
jgi:transposase, IS6 family